MFEYHTFDFLDKSNTIHMDHKDVYNEARRMDWEYVHNLESIPIKHNYHILTGGTESREYKIIKGLCSK